MAMSAIVRARSASSPAAKAPADHCSASGGASSATPASRRALDRIFSVTDEIAPVVPDDGLVLKP